MSLAALGFLAFMSSGVGLLGQAANYYAKKESNDLQRQQLGVQNDQLGVQREQLGIQKDQLNLQKESYNESLRSNYYSYMQNLASMQGDYAKNVNAINQEQENIASNMNYLDRWADEYDQSMQSNIDESFNQYQQLASNYASGLVGNAETGKRGGTAGRMASDSGIALASYNGGSTDGLNLTGGRLGSYLQSSALDMMADKQTALSAVGTSYKAIDSYQSAMESLNKSIDSMGKTTEEIKKTLEGKGMTV